MDRTAQTALTLSVVAVVPTIFGGCLPPLATVRGAPDDAHMAHSLTVATCTAAMVVALAAASSGSAEVATLGAVMVAAYALAYRSARRAA